MCLNSENGPGFSCFIWASSISKEILALTLMSKRITRSRRIQKNIVGMLVWHNHAIIILRSQYESMYREYGETQIIISDHVISITSVGTPWNIHWHSNNMSINIWTGILYSKLAVTLFRQYITLSETAPIIRQLSPTITPLNVFINNAWSWKSHKVHHPCDTLIVYCDWAEIINPHQLFRLSKSTCSWQWKSKHTTPQAIQAHRCDKSTSVTHNEAFTAIVGVWRPNASQCVAACKITFFYSFARFAGVLYQLEKQIAEM